MNELFHNMQGDGWLFEPVICFFLLTGGVFCLGGSIGLLRFPDIYCKMQALSKPVTLGIFNLVIAYIVFLFYAGQGLSMKGVLAVVFLLLTIPIGSHMMIKGAYRSGVPIWTESLMDQLADTRTDQEDNREARIRAEVSAEREGNQKITATLTEKIASAAQKEAQAEHILTEKADKVLSLYTREWARDAMNPLNPLNPPPKTAGKKYRRNKRQKRTKREK